MEDDIEDDKVEEDYVQKEEDEDVEDENVEEDDEKDDNVAEEEVEDEMLRMMMSRGRKMMMLRMMMLSRRKMMMLRMMRCRVMMWRLMRWWMMMMMSRRKRMMWRMMMLRRMILRMLMRRRKADPKTALLVLCEPAQSKCTSTFQKSHFIRNFQEKAAPEPRTTLCASLRSRNALQHFTREHFFTDFFRKNAAAQNLGPHFARVCAVEMHFNISQQQLCTEIYRKSLGPEARTTLCASLRSRNALQHFTTATFTEIYRKNARSQNRGPHFVRACAVEIHFNMSQEPLFTEIYRNNARPQNRGPHFV